MEILEIIGIRDGASSCWDLDGVDYGVSSFLLADEEEIIAVEAGEMLLIY